MDLIYVYSVEWVYYLNSHYISHSHILSENLVNLHFNGKMKGNTNFSFYSLAMTEFEYQFFVKI